MNNVITLFGVLALLYCTELYPSLAWPLAFMAGPYHLLFWFVITMFVKVLLFHAIIKKITINKSLLISLIGSVISAVLGVLTLDFLFLAKSHPYLAFLGGGKWPLPLILEFVAALIEILFIKSFFGYTFKQLWFPILAGNIGAPFLVLILRYYVLPFFGLTV